MNRPLKAGKINVPSTVIHASRSERQLRAHRRSAEFILRALAALLSPQQRKVICRRAAGQAVIHASCSKIEAGTNRLAETHTNFCLALDSEHLALADICIQFYRVPPSFFFRARISPIIKTGDASMSCAPSMSATRSRDDTSWACSQSVSSAKARTYRC